MAVSWFMNIHPIWNAPPPTQFLRIVFLIVFPGQRNPWFFMAFWVTFKFISLKMDPTCLSCWCAITSFHSLSYIMMNWPKDPVEFFSSLHCVHVVPSPGILYLFFSLSPCFFKSFLCTAARAMVVLLRKFTWPPRQLCLLPPSDIQGCALGASLCLGTMCHFPSPHWVISPQS